MTKKISVSPWGIMSREEWKKIKKSRASKIRAYNRKYADLNDKQLMIKKSLDMFKLLNAGLRPHFWETIKDEEC